MFDVKDRVAVVTGSARGLGKEIVERLLRKGAKVSSGNVDLEKVHCIEECASPNASQSTAAMVATCRRPQNLL